MTDQMNCDAGSVDPVAVDIEEVLKPLYSSKDTMENVQNPRNMFIAMNIVEHLRTAVPRKGRFDDGS